MPREKKLTPVQPYLMIDAEDYKGLEAKEMGISNFYEFNVKEDGSADFQAVPDGSTDVVFGIGKKDVKLYIGGTVLAAKQWEFEQGRTYFGARFLPGKCLLPKDLSMREIVNHDIELDSNAYGSHLAEMIAQGRDINQRSEVFVEYFRGQMQEQEEHEKSSMLECYVRNRIYESSGNVTISQLAQETGYSECYVRRVFEKEHGISPKVFERFVRFQNMLNEINADPDQSDIERLALECGYYDQSHMMKDFKTFTGTTPEKYRKMIQKNKQKIGGTTYGTIKD